MCSLKRLKAAVEGDRTPCADHTGGLKKKRNTRPRETGEKT